MKHRPRARFRRTRELCLGEAGAGGMGMGGDLGERAWPLSRGAGGAVPAGWTLPERGLDGQPEGDAASAPF